jgi:hypothetical protein
MNYNYLRVTKRGTSRVVEISADGKKWLSLERAFDLNPEKNFKIVFDVQATDGICCIEKI